MSALARTSVTLFSASWVLLTATTHAAYNGDIDYSAYDVSPTDRSRICLGANCTERPAYQGAIQSADCSQAGYGTPRPLWSSGLLRADRVFQEWENFYRDSYSERALVRRTNYDWSSIRDQYLGQTPSPGTGGSYLELRNDASKDGLDYETNPYNFRLYHQYENFRGSSFRENSSPMDDWGFDQDPIGGSFGSTGRADLGSYGLPAGDFGLTGRAFGSLNYEYNSEYTGSKTPAGSGLTASARYDVESALRQDLDFGSRRFGSIKYDFGQEPIYRQQLEVTGIILVEVNGCRVVLVPADPNYTRTGRHDGNSWGARLDDQWAIKRVGFTAEEDSAWNHLPSTAEPVIVAVIDTGLDWHHKDMSPDNIWRNADEIPDNGIDDDGNGYIDDIIGWNFLGRNNRPWDFDGHGTVVAGIIAATQDNDTGIAGINPHAKIMVLKGVNNFGTTRASYLAEAIKYAADNGARLVNLSVGGANLTQIEQAAIDYAHDKGVLVIAASGNEGIEIDDYGPSGAEHVLTVGATHTDDRAAEFSNYGDKVDLVAPGVDILSLRARFTDTNFRPETADEYTIGDRYVGDDKRYLHVNGTSFSTPIVTAVASLIMSKHPQLPAAEVERLLYETAEDIEFPGKDKYAGHGMVDAKAALSADPSFFITAEISGLEFQQLDDKDQIRVVGSIGAEAFKRAWLEIGAGENPARWKAVGQKRKTAIDNGTLSTIELSEFAGSELWQVVVNVEHRNGVIKRVVRPLRIQ